MLIAEKELTSAVLDLPPRRRAELADLLMQSPVSKEDAEVAKAWNAEAESRARAFERGELKTVSVEKAFGFTLQSMSRIMTFCLFTLFLFLLSVPAFAATPLELIVPNADKGQISRKKTPRLEVIVTNVSNLDEPVVFMNIGVEKKGSDGKFQGVRVDIHCPCNAKCEKDLTKLKRGESLTGNWDYREGNCAIAVPGVYRFVIIQRYSEAVAGYLYHGVSREFTLTK